MDGLESPRDSLIADFLSIRCLKVLCLTSPQRINILMALDCRALDHTVANLKNCSLKLFGAYRSLNSAEKQVLFAEPLDDQVGEEDEYEDIYVAAKRKTTRNRPGVEQMAIKKTQNSMNLDNETYVGRGLNIPLICFRCGKSDR